MCAKLGITDESRECFHIKGGLTATLFYLSTTETKGVRLLVDGEIEDKNVYHTFNIILNNVFASDILDNFRIGDMDLISITNSAPSIAGQSVPIVSDNNRVSGRAVAGYVMLALVGFAILAAVIMAVTRQQRPKETKKASCPSKFHFRPAPEVKEPYLKLIDAEDDNEGLYIEEETWGAANIPATPQPVIFVDHNDDDSLSKRTKRPIDFPTMTALKDLSFVENNSTSVNLYGRNRVSTAVSDVAEL